jgi:hypothetical protein
MVDADVVELPANAAAVALAAAVGGDAIPYPVELAGPLDVDVGELDGSLTLVAPRRLGRHQRAQPLRPGRLRMRLTVVAETPASAAMAWPVRRRLRSASMRSTMV